MSIKINFSADQFQSFMGVLEFLKNNCLDVSIQDGKILQENNERTVAYDIDLSNIIGLNNIYLDHIAFKYPVLEIFKRQNCKMVLEITDKKYKWYDNTSCVEFNVPLFTNLKLKPINKNSSRFNIISNVSDFLFQCTFNQSILERISSAQRSLDSKDILIGIQEDIAIFSILMGGNNTTSVMKVYTIEELQSDYKGFIRYPISSFILNSEYVNVGLAKNNSESSRFTLKLNTEIKSIPMVIWSTQPMTQK